MIQNGKPSPIQWPTVTIGGTSYTLRFTALQVMLFQERLITTPPGQEKPAPQILTVRQIFDQLAAAVSTSERTYTSSEIAEMVQAEDFAAVRQGPMLFDVLAVYMSTAEREYSRSEIIAMVRPEDIGPTMTAIAEALGKVRRPGTQTATVIPSTPEPTLSATGLN